MSEVDEMSWDGSYDTVKLRCAEHLILTISEEDETVIREHIKYHDEMKTFLEMCLNIGQTEGQMAASVYFKANKPSKPKAILGNVFEQNSQRHHQSVEEMHKFLMSKLRNQRPQEQSVSNYSVAQSWEEISFQIQRDIIIRNNRKNETLVTDLNLGLLLESGSQIYQREKILKRVTGTFGMWITKNTSISARHARRLRALAKTFEPFPRLAKLCLTTADVCNRLSDILKVLEISEYKNFWSQTN